MNRHATAAGGSRRLSRVPFHARLRAPLLFLGGALLLVAAGALLDIAHHAGLPGFAASAWGDSAHLLTLAGMLLTAVGVASVAIFRRR